MKILAVIYSYKVSLYKVFNHGARLLTGVMFSKACNISSSGSEWLIILDDGTFLWTDLIQNGGY